MDDSKIQLWPWYGVVSDPNGFKRAPHVRYKTNFYRKFKKTNKDKYLSTCCKEQIIVYD